MRASPNCRFEWDTQGAGKYPIKIESGSFYNFFAGNNYSGGCTLPNLTDANGARARYIQIDDFAHNSTYPNGYVDFNVDTLFNEGVVHTDTIELHADANSAFWVTKANNASVFNVSTSFDQVQVLNGGRFILFSDEFSTVKMDLNGSNGRLSLAGDIISTSAAPTMSTAAAAGTGATVAVTGTNTSGLLTLTIGTGPGTGKIVGFAWSATKPSANYAVVLTAANANAVTAMGRIYVDQAASTTAAASIAASVALAASTQYKFFYTVLSY